MTDDTSDAVSTSFEKVLGRAATGAERERLRYVQNALGLRDNDALWLVLFALQYYDSLYRQFPKAIGAEAARILGETKAAAETVIRASAEEARADLAKAVAIVAQDVARDVARTRITQWTSLGMIVGVAIFVAGWIMGVTVSR